MCVCVWGEKLTHEHINLLNCLWVSIGHLITSYGYHHCMARWSVVTGYVNAYGVGYPGQPQLYGLTILAITIPSNLLGLIIFVLYSSGHHNTQLIS